MRTALAAFRQIGIEKAEHVCSLDRADAFLLLQIYYALAKVFHLRPMHFWTEMVLGVIAVVEEKPVVNLAVATHAPRDRLVWIAAVMTKKPVQIAEAMAEIKEGQKKENDVAPIK